MQHGAQIIDMYETKHFDEANRSDDVCRGFIAKFYRDKAEASGWPALMRDTPFEKEPLIDGKPTSEVQQALKEYLYELNKGLCDIRPKRVEYNSRQCYIAKHCLNSLSG